MALIEISKCQNIIIPVFQLLLVFIIYEVRVKKLLGDAGNEILYNIFSFNLKTSNKLQLGALYILAHFTEYFI